MTLDRNTAWCAVALMILSLVGCATSPLVEQASVASTSPPKEIDSMLKECPREIHYPQTFTVGMPLAVAKQMIATRLAAFNLRAVWQHQRGAAFADTTDDRSRLAQLANVVLPGLERYPSSLFTDIGLTDVVLVKDLIVSQQRRRAMPDPANAAIIYADNGDELCPAGMEMRVHHELYHFIDYRVFGDFYHRDPVWLALNRGTIEYGRGGATAYGIGFQNLGHPSAGLVSRYAAYALEEDKSEVFGWMMTPGYAARVQQWVKGDEVLRAKQRFMIEQFSLRTAGAMNTDFFARIAAQ